MRAVFFSIISLIFASFDLASVRRGLLHQRGADAAPGPARPPFLREMLHLLTPVFLRKKGEEECAFMCCVDERQILFFLARTCPLPLLPQPVAVAAAVALIADQACE